MQTIARTENGLHSHQPPFIYPHSLFFQRRISIFLFPEASRGGVGCYIFVLCLSTINLLPPHRHYTTQHLEHLFPLYPIYTKYLFCLHLFSYDPCLSAFDFSHPTNLTSLYCAWPVSLTESARPNYIVSALYLLDAVGGKVCASLRRSR
jgi:hypothetical protein